METPETYKQKRKGMGWKKRHEKDFTTLGPEHALTVHCVCLGLAVEEVQKSVWETV